MRNPCYHFTAAPKYYCEDSFQGGGWVLVRRVKEGSIWHRATDTLQGTDVYGSYGTASSDSSFSIAWQGLGTELLLTTGTCWSCWGWFFCFVCFVFHGAREANRRHGHVGSGQHGNFHPRQDYSQFTQLIRRNKSHMYQIFFFWLKLVDGSTIFSIRHHGAIKLPRPRIDIHVLTKYNSSHAYLSFNYCFHELFFQGWYSDRLHGRWF